MSVLYDAQIAYDTDRVTYDGVFLGGSFDLSAFLTPRKRILLMDRDEFEGRETHGDLSSGWGRRNGLV